MKTNSLKKLILSVLILILMITNLTSAQINILKLNENKDVNNRKPALLPQEETEKKISDGGKILILSVSSIPGIIGGAFDLYGLMPIASVGAVILPVLSYELISTIRGVKRKSDKWFIKTGVNTTFTNYKKYKKRINSFIGAGISYYISDGFSINWEIFYKSRAFLLENRRVYFSSDQYDPPKSGYYDINVSNKYIDIFIMPSAKIFDFSKSNINISFGPFLSAPFRNEPRLDFIYSEDSLYCPDDVDFKYRLAEPGTTKVFAGISFGVEYELGNKIVQIKYCKALNSTNQIYAMNDKSLLNTLDLMIGFKF